MTDNLIKTQIIQSLNEMSKKELKNLLWKITA